MIALVPVSTNPFLNYSNKTAHMDVTAWSKKMLEESKIEVRELRERVSVLTSKG